MLPAYAPVRTSRQGSPIGGIIAMLVFAAVIYGGYRVYAHFQALSTSGGYSEPSDNAEQAVMTATATPEPTATPRPSVFRGKIADLPQAAQDLLAFQPAESAIQTQSATIAARVEDACGEETADYVGSADFPGSIALKNEPHGWTRVSWTLNCGGLGGSIVGKHPTAVFEISEDHGHLRDVNEAAEWLTH